MQELLTAATYLIVWLICGQVLGVESGLIKLVISLSAAIAVFILMAVKSPASRKKGDK